MQPSKHAVPPGQPRLSTKPVRPPLTAYSNMPQKTKKPVGSWPGRLTREARDASTSQILAEGSGENWRQSPDNHRPKVGSWLARFRVSRFHE